MRKLLLTALLLLLALPAHAGEAFTRYSLLSATDPAPMRLVFTLPTVVERRTSDGRTCCAPDTTPARSWMRPQVAVQQRAIDWARPVFAPVVIWEGPEQAPGSSVTVDVPHQQPGDVFVVRAVNAAGASCWSVRCVPAWRE